MPMSYHTRFSIFSETKIQKGPKRIQDIIAESEAPFFVEWRKRQKKKAEMNEADQPTEMMSKEI